jgi:Asp-tRNA(Asn)/Glu-tRNA(Gln) amidotransferase A subunit family amidase
MHAGRGSNAQDGTGDVIYQSAANASPVSGADGAVISDETMQGCAKLHGLTLSVSERALLLESIGAQLAAVNAVRGVPRPFDLQPALTFNPRLPGVRYPEQPNELRLAAANPGALPSDDRDIAFASVTALAWWIRTGALSSTRLTEIYLVRIARIAPMLKCFITVTEQVARAQAALMDEEARRGRYRGWLHGIPYALKDVFDTAAAPTTWGASLYAHRQPKEDATIVEKLREAGAVLLGKAATAELANGYEWFGGVCVNPWNSEEPAGGSSSGSASATASALCGFSIGTDSLGSIINPADRCGIVGLRPTFGRVPTRGGMPLTPSLERVGPLCRTIEDSAIVLSAIHGIDKTSATSVDVGFKYDANIDLHGIKVGYSPDWFKRVGYAIGTGVPVSDAHRRGLATLEKLGATLVRVDLPQLPYDSLFSLLEVEAAAVFEELTMSNADDQLIKQGPFAWPNIWRKARLLSAVDYLQIERFRRQVMWVMDGLFTQVDALIAPPYGCYQLLWITNFTGHPGVTFRVGFADSPARAINFDVIGSPEKVCRIPQNLALYGRLYEEGTILAIARAVEYELRISGERPPVN